MLGKINSVLEKIKWGPTSGCLLGKKCFYEVAINTLLLMFINKIGKRLKYGP